MNRIVAIQMASGPNIGANLIEVERLLSQAADSGAQLVVLPENFSIMGLSEVDKVKAGESEGSGPMQDFLSRMARQYGVWIVGGTIPLKTDDPGKVSASCLVVDDTGQTKACYDKIHLFDVQIEGSGEEYTESATILPGHGITVVDTPVGRLGLAICYDLRFPEMFRSMLDLGAEIIAVPSAFTAFTGKAHWESLVRARAIENQCYLVASAQGGYHLNGRETYGHSMVVDPWGTILDELANGSGIVGAEIDLQLVRRIRERFPSISHRRWQNLSNDSETI